MTVGCSGQPPIPPNRIISNNPCVDAILAEVATPGQVGAVSVWSHAAESSSAPLAWAAHYPAIGAGAEEVIAARPSLALIGAFGSTTALDKAGVRHLGFGVPASVSESEVQVRSIAGAIARPAAGEALVVRIERAATPLLPSAAERKTAIIWLANGFAPGQGTLQDELLARAGFRNASATYGLKQWDVLPLEALIRRPPDVIFTPVSVSGDARALSLRLRLLGRLTPQPRIVPFPEKLLNCGGPSIVAAMQIMARAR
jgi:iron complex transport system substrate-binding protein